MWSAPRPGRLHFGNRATSNHWDPKPISQLSGTDEKLLSLTGIKPCILGHPVCSLATTATEAPKGRWWMVYRAATRLQTAGAGITKSRVAKQVSCNSYHQANLTAETVWWSQQILAQFGLQGQSDVRFWILVKNVWEPLPIVLTSRKSRTRVMDHCYST
jgi:hypothetical protein